MFGVWIWSGIVRSVLFDNGGGRCFFATPPKEQGKQSHAKHWYYGDHYLWNFFMLDYNL